MLFILLALQVASATPVADPFAFFQPSVTITADDRGTLDRGQPIAHVLPSKDLEVAVLAAVPINIDGDRLVSWMRRIEELKKSSYVLAIGRFSDPPRIEDLAALSLDDKDLSDIRACRPGHCGLNLSAGEMVELQRAAAEALDGQAGLQQAFRRILLTRVQTYLTTGQIGAYEDEKNLMSPATRFAPLLDHSAFLTGRLPQLAEHLRGFPLTVAPGAESFVYWSKERLASKAVVSITHVTIVRGHDPDLPDALVAGKQVYSAHYVNASLGVTALMRGEPEGSNYLVYVNRSEVDMLGGTFGGVIRWFMQRRLKAEAATVLQNLRRRLEGGEPPPAVVTSAR